jgi:hypothetical protein
MSYVVVIRKREREGKGGKRKTMVSEMKEEWRKGAKKGSEGRGRSKEREKKHALQYV